MSHDFIATISRESTRYQEWMEVMGDFVIPLKSPFPAPGSAPGVAVGMFYEIDLSAITAEQRARMITHLARKFGFSEEEVASTLDEVGCPILADDVTVIVSNPQRWI